MSDQITGRQAVSLMFLFVLGSSLVTGGSMKAEQDSWITVLIGLIFAVPVVLMYARLNVLCPESDLFDMSYLAFGKVIGAVVTLLFSLYALHLGAMVIKDFTEYIQVLSLHETPQLVCAVCIGLLACFAVQSGIEAPARNAEFVAPIACTVIVVLLFLTEKDMDFTNLQPVLAHDAKLLLSEGFASLTFPFAETVMFLSVFCTVKDPGMSFPKYYLWGLFLPGLILITLIAGNIAVLGVPLTKALFFPSYETVGIVDVGNFISRIEVLVSGNFMIFGLIKVMVCLYVGCRGLARLFGVKHFKVFTVAAASGMVVVSQLLYTSTMQLFAFLSVYKYYAPCFEIALPFVVLLTLTVKKAVAAKKPSGTEDAEKNTVPQ